MLSPRALVNTLRPRWNWQHFADDIFKRIFFNENVWISFKISLKFVPKGSIINIAALVQIMAWRRPGDKLLSEQMMVSLPTYICVTRPQWVKGNPTRAKFTAENIRIKKWFTIYIVLLDFERVIVIKTAALPSTCISTTIYLHCIMCYGWMKNRFNSLWPSDVIWWHRSGQHWLR